MKKSVFCFLISLLCSGVLCAQEQVVIDGLWYSISGSLATIIQKPDGSPYAGSVTIKSSITLPDGKVCAVSPETSVFNYSEVEELIIDAELYNPESGAWFKSMNRYDYTLQRIQFMHLLDPKEVSFPPFSVSAGLTRNCVRCYFSESSTEVTVRVEEFNIFGADGAKLKPALYSNYTQEYLFPDENNVFHLSNDMVEYDQYSVLPISSYAVVNLAAVDENGNFARVRTEVQPWESGDFTTVDGVRYEVNQYKLWIEAETQPIAAIVGIDPDAIGTELTLPETVKFNGTDYFVSHIPENTFSNLPLTSVTLPSSLKYMESGAFSDCPDLERVDMSAIKEGSYYRVFIDCPVLSEVVLPEPGVRMSSLFSNCPSMQYLEVYPGGNYYNLAGSGTGLFDAEGQWRQDETFAVTVKQWGFHYTDGTPAPIEVFKYYNYLEYHYNEDGSYSSVDSKNIYYDAIEEGDGIYVLKLSDFHTPDPTKPNAPFSPEILFGSKPENGGSSYSCLAVFMAPEPGLSDVVEVSIDDSAPVEYYNLQGVRIPENRLSPGLYIRRQGTQASKILVR